MPEGERAFWRYSYRCERLVDNGGTLRTILLLVRSLKRAAERFAKARPVSGMFFCQEKPGYRLPMRPPKRKPYAPLLRSLP